MYLQYIKLGVHTRVLFLTHLVYLERECKGVYTSTSRCNGRIIEWSRSEPALTPESSLTYILSSDQRIYCQNGISAGIRV